MFYSVTYMYAYYTICMQVINSGVLKDLTHKFVVGCFSECEIIHQIQVMLFLHSDGELADLIRTNCKVAGPSVPSFRREMTMPVWWTVEQDILLLRAVLEGQYGWAQWRKISLDSRLCSAPFDFVMPPKPQGTIITCDVILRNNNRTTSS